MQAHGLWTTLVNMISSSLMVGFVFFFFFQKFHVLSWNYNCKDSHYKSPSSPYTDKVESSDEQKVISSWDPVINIDDII